MQSLYMFVYTSSFLTYRKRPLPNHLWCCGRFCLSFLGRQLRWYRCLPTLRSGEIPESVPRSDCPHNANGIHCRLCGVVQSKSHPVPGWRTSWRRRNHSLQRSTPTARKQRMIWSTMKHSDTNLIFWYFVIEQKNSDFQASWKSKVTLKGKCDVSFAKECLCYFMWDIRNVARDSQQECQLFIPQHGIYIYSSFFFLNP